MNTLPSLKICLWSVALVTGLTGSAFAQKGHTHSGGATHHHHHGYSGGSSSFRFGYGGFGFGGFGYGSPSYGYGLGRSFYGYGPNYGYSSGLGLRIYSTPSYYYSTPSYLYPSYSTPTYSYPSTVIINSTPSAPAPAFDNGPIVITSPAANDQPIDYQLNGQPYTIKPGQSQKFNHDRDWIVDFNRGDGKGAAKYSLKATVYKFKMTDNGWELFEAAKPEPPMDPAPPVPAPDESAAK